MQQEITANEDQILLRSPSDPLERFGSRGSATAASAAFVRSIIRARALRRQFFDQNLFADPAWDILLELYALKCEGLRVSVSKLSITADVPCTTALRWIDKLEAEWLVVRQGDPLDGRRVWVELSDLGTRAMDTYVQQISSPAIGI